MRGERTIFTITVWSAIALAMPAKLCAQAPAGPLPAAQPQPPSPGAKAQGQAPQVQPRASIFGAWKLNRDESDDARKKMQERSEERRVGKEGRSRWSPYH